MQVLPQSSDLLIETALCYGSQLCKDVVIEMCAEVVPPTGELCPALDM